MKLRNLPIEWKISAAFLLIAIPLILGQETGLKVIAWVSKAEVLSAIATAVAAIVALYLGLSGTRRADAQALAAAELVAASISGPLAQAAQRVVQVSAILVFRDSRDASWDIGTRLMSQQRTAEGILQALRLLRFRPDEGQLLRLVPLPNQCAHRIAKAIGLLEDVRADVADMLEFVDNHARWRTWDVDSREELLTRWDNHVQMAQELLSVASAECNRATAIEKLAPTIEELYGEC